MNPSVQTFCNARVFTLRNGYEEVINEKVTLKELRKAWNRFRYGIPQIAEVPLNEFKRSIDEILEAEKTNQEGVYQHLRVFYDTEDRDEFLAEHQANKLKDETVLPSDQMAEQILANPNRKELVRGLIEDKRRLYGDCDELEAKLDATDLEIQRLKSALREVSALLLQIPNLVSVLLEPVTNQQSSTRLLQTLPPLTLEISTSPEGLRRAASDRSGPAGQSGSQGR